MKRKIRYQAKTDLKLLRRINGISKEYVADKIGYTIRSLERMKKKMRLQQSVLHINYAVYMIWCMKNNFLSWIKNHWNVFGDV